jgi:hypothetical protein
MRERTHALKSQVSSAKCFAPHKMALIRSPWQLFTSLPYAHPTVPGPAPDPADGHPRREKIAGSVSGWPVNRHDEECREAEGDEEVVSPGVIRWTDSAA